MRGTGAINRTLTFGVHERPEDGRGPRARLRAAPGHSIPCRGLAMKAKSTWAKESLGGYAGAEPEQLLDLRKPTRAGTPKLQAGGKPAPNSEITQSSLVRLARPPAPFRDGTTVGTQSAARPLSELRGGSERAPLDSTVAQLVEAPASPMALGLAAFTVRSRKPDAVRRAPKAAAGQRSPSAAQTAGESRLFIRGADR